MSPNLGKIYRLSFISFRKISKWLLINKHKHSVALFGDPNDCVFAFYYLKLILLQESRYQEEAT